MTVSFKAKPFSAKQHVDCLSDIDEVHLMPSGEFRVVIARETRPDNKRNGVVVSFKNAREFRMLDEFVIYAWVASDGFVRGHHVVEVLQGGWNVELAALQVVPMERREWLVVSGNNCVSVMSEEPPEISDIVLPALD